MRRSAKTSKLAAAMLTALGTIPLAAQAATIIVTTTGDPGTTSDCTLRQTIVTMNHGSTPGSGEGGCRAAATGMFGSGDTINFDTTAFPSGGPNTITLTTGQLSITASHLTIDATANGNVTIDANHLSRVMNDSAVSGDSLTLNHLTLSNGKATVSDCQYASNSGPDGGAICIGAANLTLNSGTLSGNSANGNGGGIFAFGGGITLASSTFTNNSASEAGGGIYGYKITLIDSTLSGNSAQSEGGGIFSKNVTLTNSTLKGNIAQGKGGGIFSIGGVTLTNSTLSGNSATGSGTASYGGGITVTPGTALVLTNSTLSGNSSNYGGGIGGHAVEFASITLTNSTISANSAVNYGGGIDLANAIDNSITVDNSIIAGNTQGSGGDVQGNVTSSAFSLIGGNPMLGALANNGGPTQTMLPQAGSPAIDAMLCSHAPPTDQRGYIRPDPGSAGSLGLCDIGAVETGSIPDEIFKNGFE